MVSKKYTKDYRLENVISQSGKVVVKPVYCGKYYNFTADERSLRYARVCISAMTGVYWLFFWAGLFLSSGAMHRFYVSIPYFFGFLPAVFLTAAVYSLWKVTLNPRPAGLTREQKDKLYDRLAQSSFLALCFAVLSAVGVAVYYIIGADGYSGFSDIAVIVSIIVMIISSATVINVKKYTKMQVQS